MNKVIVALLGFAILISGVQETQADTIIFSQETLTRLEDHALEGHPMAQSMIGIMYLYGYGLPKSKSKAEVWLQMAAEQGEPVAQYELALINFSNGEEGVANKLVKQSAEKGFYLAKELMRRNGFRYNSEYKLPRLEIDTSGMSRLAADEMLANASYKSMKNLLAFLDANDNTMPIAECEGLAICIDAEKHAVLTETYDTIVHQSDVKELKIRRVKTQKRTGSRI